MCLFLSPVIYILQRQLIFAHIDKFAPFPGDFSVICNLTIMFLVILSHSEHCISVYIFKLYIHKPEVHYSFFYTRNFVSQFVILSKHIYKKCRYQTENRPKLHNICKYFFVKQTNNSEEGCTIIFFQYFFFKSPKSEQ